MANFKRRFDWDEIRALRASGLSNSQVAERVGCSVAMVQMVCNDVTRAKVYARRAAWQNERVKEGRTCPQCGGRMCFSTDARGHRRCAKCADAARAWTVREDALFCTKCATWKVDDEFPRAAANKQRRGRHGRCRVCTTRTRRESRARSGR